MMQVMVGANGQDSRVRRDGPSPAQQAQQAALDELSASLASTQARIQQLVEDGAEQTAAGRAEIAEAREQVATTAAQMRSLASDMRESAIEEAAQAMAARAFAGGQGRTTTSTRAPDEIPDIPPRVRDVSMLFIMCLAAAIVLTPLMRAFGRMLERRATPPQRLTPEIESQLTRMEQAIETVAIELERVSEGQRFATKLLADRDRVGELRS